MKSDPIIDELVVSMGRAAALTEDLSDGVMEDAVRGSVATAYRLVARLAVIRDQHWPPAERYRDNS